MSQTLKVKLTKNVRVYGQRREAGEIVEVDKLIYAELLYHQAVEEPIEVIEHDSEPPAATAIEGDTNNDGHLTVDEIKAELDKRGISYKGVRKRDELLALLEQPEAGE